MTQTLAPSNFRQWFAENLAEDHGRDIAEHGADCGFPHITYTSDTVELFDMFGEELWEMACDDARDFGEKNVMAFIAGFRRDDMAESLAGFKNLMVWYACERLAHEMA